MEEKFIVSLEDVQEFLKEKLGLDWDGYVYDFDFEKNSDLIKLVNKEKAKFYKKNGNEYKSKTLSKLIVARDREGVDSYYSLFVDSFLSLRVWECNKYGTQTHKRFGYCDRIWRDFLIEKYGDLIKCQMIDYHKAKLENFVSTRNDLLENAEKLTDNIEEEIKFLSDLGETVVIENNTYPKIQDDDELDF